MLKVALSVRTVNRKVHAKSLFTLIMRLPVSYGISEYADRYIPRNFFDANIALYFQSKKNYRRILLGIATCGGTLRSVWRGLSSRTRRLLSRKNKSPPAAAEGDSKEGMIAYSAATAVTVTSRISAPAVTRITALSPAGASAEAVSETVTGRPLALTEAGEGVSQVLSLAMV